LGDPADPLLVSVRSGAKFSMPGMMDTVLNIGLNDDSVQGLAEQAGSARFAWDSYRRLLQMFGRTVLGVEGFEHALDAAKRAKGVTSDLDLDDADLRSLVDRYKAIVQEGTGQPFPQDPRTQLELAVRAVFDSWDGERAVLYRRQERIPADLGTAVNVCTMVFGNLGMDSGTGVAFTRDPSSGAQGVYGDYLQNAQGEDVVAGIRNTVPLADLEGFDPASYDELVHTMKTLEQHYRDLCDIEFTIERGTLWMLQTRVGKRTAGAAFRIATQLVDEGLISEDEALDRVTGAQLARLMFPAVRADDDATKDLTVLGTGMGASPGAGGRQGGVRQRHRRRLAARGEDVVLVRRETTPGRPRRHDRRARGAHQPRWQDQPRRPSSRAGMGKTCVCGAEDLDVDLRGKTITAPTARSSRGRRAVDRRHERQRVPRRGARAAEPGRAVLRGRARARDRATTSSRRCTACSATPTPPGGSACAPTPTTRGRRTSPPVRRRRDRPVPDRAHVPRRPPSARRGPRARRGRRRPGRGPGRPATSAA
jgi:pyruvate,orthophosphate dikinase